MPQQSTSTSKRTSAKAVAGKGATSKGAAAKGVSGKQAKISKSAQADTAKSTGNGEDRHSMIATAAYYRAEKRGFNGGCSIDDWLEAEAEIDAMLYH